MPEVKLFEETMREAENFLSNRERGKQFTDSQIKECVDLLTNAKRMAPHTREYLIREALTTSDFPYLFGDVLDRQVLAAYKATEPVWKKFTRMSTVRDFRTAYRFTITGGDQTLDEVPEKGEYQASDRNEAKKEFKAKKYGRQFDISWESIINDDLGALKDTPERFARAAVRTEHRQLSTTYINDLGTHAANNLYDATTAGEINSAALPLSIGNLENTVEAMQSFLDAAGEPIWNKPKYLVVGPALEFTARQILTSTTKMWLADSDDVTPPAAYPMTNVISQYGLELVVDPYIPILDASYPGSWYLFADPRDIAALEFAYLAGHERPEICMKDSDKVAIGGGAISAMSGDFATDNIFYRVRDVFGICKLDWRATYMQRSA